MNIWIGTLHVTPKSGNDLLEGAIGAFVPILAFADSEQDFASKAQALMQAYEFNVLEILDVELFNERRKHSEISEGIVSTAQRLCNSEPIAPCTFQGYDSIE